MARTAGIHQPAQSDVKRDNAGYAVIQDTTMLEPAVANTHSAVQSSTKQTGELVAILVLVIISQLVLFTQDILLPYDNFTLSCGQRNIATIIFAIPALAVSVVVVTQIRSMGLNRHARKSGTPLSQLETDHPYKVSSLLFAAGILAASITSSWSINTGERTRNIDGASLFAVNPDTPSFCYRETPESPQNNVTLAWYTSTSGENGTYLNARQSRSGTDDGWSPCPIDYWRTLSAVRKIRGLGYGDGIMGTGGTREDDCLNVLGGSVSCSALGAPLAANFTCSVFQPFQCRSGNTNQACVPVFTKNPVSCRITGTLTGNRYIRQVDAIESEKCSVQASNVSRNALIRGYNGQLTGFCPQDDSPGDMSFVIGTYYPNTFAPLFGKEHLDTESVVVECNLSINETMNFKTVTNTTSDVITNHGTFALPVLNSTDESCDPGHGSSIEQVMTTDARLAAASLLYGFLNDPVLDNSRWSNARLGLESNQMDEHGGYPVPTLFAFPDSQNAMEDFLGAMVSGYMGYYFSGVISHGFQDMQYNSVPYKATYSVSADRLGPAGRSTILYTLPTLGALVVMLSMWYLEKRDEGRGESSIRLRG